MKKMLFTLLLLNVLYGGFSQNASLGKLSGTVVEDNKKPLEYVSVTLHRAKDSVFVKGGLTDNKGVFEMENLKMGQYFIRISQVGFEKYGSELITLSENTPSVFD